MDVSKDPDAELEVLVLPANVLCARDVQLGLWDGHDVDERLLVGRKDDLAALARDLCLKVYDPATGGGKLTGVEVRHLDGGH